MRFEHIQHHNIHTCTFIHSNLRNRLNPEKMSKRAFSYRLLKSSDDALDDSLWIYQCFLTLNIFLFEVQGIQNSVLKQFKTF